MKQGLIVITLKSGATVETAIAIKGDMIKALEAAAQEILELNPGDFYGIGNICVKKEDIAAIKATDLTLNLGGK